MSSRGNIIFTIFGNSFITQDYTEKSKKIQSENIIGVRYVQLSGNMDYDDHRIVVRSFLASEIDLIWSFTMKKYLLTHLVLRRQVWSKKYCFPILLFLFFWKAKKQISILFHLFHTADCLDTSTHKVVSRILACRGGGGGGSCIGTTSVNPRTHTHTLPQLGAV